MRDMPTPLAAMRGPQRPIHRPDRPPAAQPLQSAWASTQDEVREAQRLRHDVFALEMGAHLTPPPGAPPGHDADLFDPYCEHLLVRAPTDDDAAGMIIGTCRVLTPDAACRIGGLYSDTEFDLTRLRPLRHRMLELGRCCVHADWRAGAVMLVLWSALGDFMTRHRLDTLIGCASVSIRDGGHVAASLWQRLRVTHLAPIEQQVRPRLALPVDERDHGLDVEVPALIKGYLRCGAMVLGPPAWDPDFNTADLPLIMQLGHLPARHRRHFLG